MHNDIHEVSVEVDFYLMIIDQLNICRWDFQKQIQI